MANFFSSHPCFNPLCNQSFTPSPSTPPIHSIYSINSINSFTSTSLTLMCIVIMFVVVFVYCCRSWSHLGMRSAKFLYKLYQTDRIEGRQ